MEKMLTVLDIFTDESLGDRFKSLCSVSLLDANLKEIQDVFRNILSKYKVSEIKFNELRTHKPKIDCAKKFIEEAINLASQKQLRIDVLIWDTQDSRHNIVGRDDKENLERMYYHLLRTVIEAWKIFKFNWYPDEQSEYDYKKIAEFISSTKYPRKDPPNLLKLFEEERIQFVIKKLEVQKSHHQPLIQLADLFAGFGCFSREQADKFYEWKCRNEAENNLRLFTTNIDNLDEENKTIINRFKLITNIAKECKGKGISVSIDSNNYLKSFKKELHINFWHYESQGEYDKAPTKRKRD